MNKETFKKIGIPVAAVIASVGLGFAGITSAQTATTSTASATARAMTRVRPSAVGKVTAISGTRITVSSTNPKDNTVTLYTVDAGSATIEKGTAGLAPTAASLADVVIGDTVAVEGTVTGTTIQATKILDGIMARGGMGKGPGGHRPMGQDGNVTAISGTTITMAEEADEGGTVYTVDAANATFSNNGTAGTIADIKVGDKVFVDGTVTGTNVAASAVNLGHPGGHGHGPDTQADGESPNQ
ncbi:MAG: hypothetical protein JWM46_183 [Candidatus Kaiserbacteria bacterium]|nr:hypothetical protein [Candidatus Kaiserbacteria bacterium]